MMQPPWLLQPLALVERLSPAAGRQGPRQSGEDADRHRRAGPLRHRPAADTLAPLSSDMAGRFNLWLGREQTRRAHLYDQAQLGWLEAYPRPPRGQYRGDHAPTCKTSFAARGGIHRRTAGLSGHAPRCPTRRASGRAGGVTGGLVGAMAKVRATAVEPVEGPCGLYRTVGGGKAACATSANGSSMGGRRTPKNRGR